MSDDMPDVVRHLSWDQGIGHKELCRAKVARAIKVPPAWTCEERDDGATGYYLQTSLVTGAIWGAIPHAPDEAQRWGWAIYAVLKGERVEIASERPTPDNLDTLATDPHHAHLRMVRAYESWRAQLPTLPLLRWRL